MRSAFCRCLFFILLFCINLSVFAQDKALELKLNAIKAKDSLSTWIYERLDYAKANPKLSTAYLTETQQKLWRQAKGSDEMVAWLNLLNTQGYSSLLDGNILNSINRYEAALNYYLKNKVAVYDIVEYTLKPLSNNYTRLGDYERALYLQLLTVKYLVQTNDTPENIAAIYSNIAISYRSMGNLVEAEKSVKAGLQISQKSKINIILNNILADILFDKQAYTEAAKLIESNISKQKNINFEHAYCLMGSYTTAGNIFKKLNNLKLANSYFNKALSILNKYYSGTRLREKANILTQLGTIKLLEKKPQLAIHYFNQTLVTLKITSANKVDIGKIYGDNMLVDVFQEMATAHLLLKNSNEAYQNIKLALLSADKIRNEFADDQTKERLQANLKLIAEKGIEICFSLYQKTKDQSLLNELLNLAEQSKGRILLDQIKRNQFIATANQKDSLFIKKQNYERAIIYNEKQEIEGSKQVNVTTTAKLKYLLALINKQIKQKYTQFNTDTYSSPIQDVLAKLPNKKIINYFFGKDAIYLIDIEHRKVNNVVKLANAAEIKSSILSYVDTYFQHGPNAMINNPKLFYKAAHNIYKSILKGISLTKNQSIIIVPDEILGYISFDGLITNSDFTPNISSWPFLIKSNTITYAFSLKTLVSSKTEVNHKEFVGLFITHQKNNNKPLKAVEVEANGIKRIVRGKFLFNAEVNSKTFNQVFEESKVLHIGTHAYLSGRNQEPTLAFDREKVFLFELAAKKNAPSLVVLSACRTADGLLAKGEGIISLSRGFNAIGTPATIASLWNVNDVAASVITNSFYTHLVANRTSGTALHEAKIDWLNNTQATNVFYLPYYWDSLIYMGTDQQIDLSPAINWLLIFGIACGLILALSMYLLLKKKPLKKQVFSI